MVAPSSGGLGDMEAEVEVLEAKSRKGLEQDLLSEKGRQELLRSEASLKDGWLLEAIKSLSIAEQFFMKGGSRAVDMMQLQRVKDTVGHAQKEDSLARAFGAMSQAVACLDDGKVAQARGLVTGVRELLVSGGASEERLAELQDLERRIGDALWRFHEDSAEAAVRDHISRREFSKAREAVVRSAEDAIKEGGKEDGEGFSARLLGLIDREQQRVIARNFLDEVFDAIDRGSTGEARACLRAAVQAFESSGDMQTEDSALVDEVSEKVALLEEKERVRRDVSRMMASARTGIKEEKFSTAAALLKACRHTATHSNLLEDIQEVCDRVSALSSPLLRSLSCLWRSIRMSFSLTLQFLGCLAPCCGVF